MINDREIQLEAVNKGYLSLEALIQLTGRKCTAQEIVQGIQPTESAINAVQATMIAEQTRNTAEQLINTGEQKQ